MYKYFLLWLISSSLLSDAQVVFNHKGSLIIIGGGDIPDTIYQLFAKKIGGKDQPMVYIPTATQNEDWIQSGKHLEKFTSKGFTNISTVHTRDRNKANDDIFPAMIRRSNGVFLGGGDQERLASVYVGTATHQALLDLLDRGGVIMGTSAGATIMGSLLIGGDHRKTPHQKSSFKEGFSFMKQTAIDQHVLVRNRQFDLVSVLENHPDIFGLALDEATAALVEADGIRVLGNSYMLIFDPLDWNRQKKELGRVYRPFNIYAAGTVYKIRRN